VLRGFAVALVTGLVAGLVPAIRSSRTEIVASLRSA
jgi:ABC-type antimicrobial peptide transport system permease subunit